MTSKNLFTLALRAAHNRWVAQTSVSTNDLQAIARAAVTGAEMLAHIAEACLQAQKQGAALSPEGLLNYLNDNNIFEKDEEQNAVSSPSTAVNN
jgi:hypothetical protein